MFKSIIFLTFFISGSFIFAQPYAPQAGTPGSTAIYKGSTSFTAWATDIRVVRGFQNIQLPGLGLASSGVPENAIGYPDGNVVSLGDKGYAVATFEHPIRDGQGYDFAVFENGSVGYLELATVAVSSDGVNYYMFPSHSLTQTHTQLGTFDTPVAQNLHNLAGKYIGDYGTPFDLSDIQNAPLLDKQAVRFVKITDVCGSLNPVYATYDSYGNKINDSFPTPFPSGGFDLQAVGVIHEQLLSEEIFDLSTLKVYPNPFTTKLFISDDYNSEIEYELKDLLGKTLLRGRYYGGSIDTGSLPSGVYLLTLQSQGKKRNLKMIKK